MVTLDVIRAKLQKQLQLDNSIRLVEVHADSLDEALADAAVQLDSKISLLEYEVIEYGSEGFLGLAKTPWHIRVYENVERKATQIKAASRRMAKAGAAEQEEEQIVVKDGEFYIHRFGSDVMLKVVLPEGDGKPVSFKEVFAAIKLLAISTIDEVFIKGLVEKGTNSQYENVAVYEHIQSADSVFTLIISSDGMEATISARAPLRGGSEIASIRVMQVLESEGVARGYDTALLEQFVDKPVYGTPTVIARGQPPQHGRSSYVSYNFESDPTKLRVKETADGSVDFKELNLIQNVVAGQPLARKVPAEQGIPGRTLYGNPLPANDGKDIAISLGKNVKFDIDGETILAETNGRVLLTGGRVTVEPIMQVAGDVSVKTGNITFLGTVVVKGNVNDGFNIKASGNIEVSGTVGVSTLEADGDIIVSLGINGHNEGLIRSGKSVWARFIQNATVEAEDSVIVSDGIINSNVMATRQILVQGKRATILGGRLIATELISAKTLGSNGGGNETVLEVGYDPKAKRRLDELIVTQGTLIKELEELDLNLQTLMNIKKVRKTLPPDKEESYVMFVARKDEIMAEADSIAAEIQEIQERFKTMEVFGKVSVSGTAYAGVKIHVRDAHDDLRMEVHSATFVYGNEKVQRVKYEAPEVVEAKR